MVQPLSSSAPQRSVETVPPSNEAMITVLLVDDQPQVLHGLEMLLALEVDVRVVGTADTAEMGIELAGRLRPDVIVMDVRLPGLDGISATRRLLDEFPGCAVVILTLYSDAVIRRQAQLAGASAFVAKHDPERPLPATIRQVVAQRRASVDQPGSSDV